MKFGAEILGTREVVALEPAGSARVLRFNDGSAVTAQSVILATRSPTGGSLRMVWRR